MRPQKRYHALHVAAADMEWRESGETLAALMLAWAASEGARQFVRAHPPRENRAKYIDIYLRVRTHRR